MIIVAGFVQIGHVVSHGERSTWRYFSTAKLSKAKSHVTEREMKKYDLDNRGKKIVKQVYQWDNEGQDEEGFMGL